MLAILIFYIAVSIISATILLYLMKSAPSGWEDKEGFHLSKNKN